jgi:peptide/nickel transport system permease protein
VNHGYLVKRGLQMVVTLWAVSVVVFFLLRITPGDPVTMMLGDWASQEQVEQLRRDMGLNQPLLTQYLRFTSRLLRGDLGLGIRSQRPALELVLERFPATLELTLAAFALAILVGLPIGVLSAVKRFTVYDNASVLMALLAQSMPGFWLGLMLIVVFAVNLGMLPVSGRDGLQHIILPAVTLSFYLLGLIIRVSRSEMLDVMEQDYMRTARAKGLPEIRLLVRHGFRNCLIPIVTILGLQLGTLLGGAVVTETVFGWPGMGMLTVLSIYNRDYPVVQAAVLVFAAIFVAINAGVDVLYYYLDPRIKES